MKNKLSLNIIVLFIVLNTLTLNPFVDIGLSSDRGSRQNNSISGLSSIEDAPGDGNKEKEKKESFLKTINIKEYIPLRIVNNEKWLGMI